MYKLRYYQQEAVESVFDYYLNGGKEEAIIGAPTGTGKSLIIAGIVKRAIEDYPSTRVLILTHVKELVKQNAQKLLDIWPLAPMGINSAGLKRRDTMQQIIYAGIGSIQKNAQVLGVRNLIIVDEAHRISPKEQTMYQKAFDDLKALYPNLKIVKLSATLYRMKHGALNGHVVFDNTDMESFNRLIKEGFLCTLIPKRPDLQVDTSQIKIRAGEFVDSSCQSIIDKDDVNLPAVRELIAHSEGRRSGIVYTSGIEHCMHVTDIFEQMGASVTCVHSKLKPKERDERLQAWLNGEIFWMINKDVFTTGLDSPMLDLMGDLQPTMSVVKHVQKNGRLTRVFEGKENGLVLDFVGNTLRLGPINDPLIPRTPSGKKTTPGDAPIRICDECGTYNHASAKFCSVCGEEFPRVNKIKSYASDAELIKQSDPKIEEYEVTKVFYKKHKAKSGNYSMKVTYFCGLRSFDEYVSLGYYGKGWWQRRHESELPKTVDEMLLVVSELTMPKFIKVDVNSKYNDIKGYEN